MKSTTKRHPFRVGDRLRISDEVPLRRGSYSIPYDTRGYSERLKQHTIYTVRKAFSSDDLTQHAVLLGGIYSVLNHEGGGEWGLPAALFQRVARCGDCPPPPAEDLHPYAIDVPVPAATARQLRLLRLADWVEPFLRFDDDDEDGPTTTRLWMKKNPWRFVGSPFAAIQSRMAKQIAAGDSQLVHVPLPEFSHDDLGRIAAALSITPEAWLQGVLGHLAARVRSAQSKSA